MDPAAVQNERKRRLAALVLSLLAASETTPSILSMPTLQATLAPLSDLQIAYQMAILAGLDIPAQLGNSCRKWAGRPNCRLWLGHNDITSSLQICSIGEYLVSELIHKLQALKLAAKKPSALKVTPMMSTLSENLTAVLEELSVPSGILPARRKVAPNEGSGWNKTASLMGAPLKGVRVKTAPQSKYPDPHSGKAASGTLAKADAKKGPLGTSATIPNIPPMPNPTPFPFTFTAPFLSSGFNPPTIDFGQKVSYISSTPPDFNAATFDLRDTAALKSLLRHVGLRALCRHYGVKEKGSNYDIIEELQKHTPKQ
ncbi:hypothetical protein C8J56DRAFT_1048429 [Mycena floridula]|nr:hypothetical protein C8J56DRAFT_1048429 [Mycena floridula]